MTTLINMLQSEAKHDIRYNLKDVMHWVNIINGSSFVVKIDGALALSASYEYDHRENVDVIEIVTSETVGRYVDHVTFSTLEGHDVQVFALVANTEGEL